MRADGPRLAQAVAYLLEFLNHNQPAKEMSIKVGATHTDMSTGESTFWVEVEKPVLISNEVMENAFQPFGGSTRRISTRVPLGKSHR